ncbi:GFA family protein [Roseobacteraceae bacterium S113]
MPSEALKGRCYCGAVQVEASAAPITVAYCHCSDCRRLSGAPVGAFAAFAHGLHFEPPLGAGFSMSEGVRRWFCQACGTPLAATYAYLPGQTYVPVGVFDAPEALAPEGHSHAASQLPWLHLADDLPRDAASARDRLNEAGA